MIQTCLLSKLVYVLEWGVANRIIFSTSREWSNEPSKRNTALRYYLVAARGFKTLANYYPSMKLSHHTSNDIFEKTKSKPVSEENCLLQCVRLIFIPLDVWFYVNRFV